jgi:hypothetical protein
MKVDALRAVADRVRHLHAMVERHVTTRDPDEAEAHGRPLKRELGRFKRDLTAQGFDALALQAGDMERAVGRGASARHRARILREGVANLRALIDQEQRRVVAAETSHQQADHRDAAVKSNDD